MNRDATRYPFDGESLTLTEIMARVPCMSRTAVRNGLAKGRTTQQQLLCADCRQDRRVTRLRKAATA